jgi:hypothetical protein
MAQVLVGRALRVMLRNCSAVYFVVFGVSLAIIGAAQRNRSTEKKDNFFIMLLNVLNVNSVLINL